MTSDRYQTKRLPGGYIRVVDLEEDRVEGAWNQEDKRWFDFQAFMDHHAGEGWDS